MKETVVTACSVVVLTAAVAAAQEKPAPAPATEQKPALTLQAVLDSTGDVLIKDYFELGRVSGVGRVNLQAIVVTIPNPTETGFAPPTGLDASARVRGFRIEVTDGENNERSAMAVLDQGDVERLAKALEYIEQVARTWKSVDKQEHSEVEFATAAGLRVGFYQRRRDQGAVIAAGPSPQVRAFIDMDELARIRTFVLRGLSLLNSR